MKYRISANSFRGNYSFLKLTLCTVTFGHNTYRCGNYSRAETIRGNTVYEKDVAIGPKKKFQNQLWICIGKVSVFFLFLMNFISILHFSWYYPTSNFSLHTFLPSISSDFAWHTYLPKNRTSFMNVPLDSIKLLLHVCCNRS